MIRLLSITLVVAVLAGLAGPAPVARASQTLTFSSSGGITIPGSGTGATTGAPASVYPSQIAVSGFTPGSGVNTMRVTLIGLSHHRPDDIDMMLVSPGGHQAVIFSDVGGTADVDNITITLDDAAANILPSGSPLSSGTFQPTNQNASGDTPDAFPAPAPTPESNRLLSTFRGDDPNGTWQLFVTDDESGTEGLSPSTGFLFGWKLEITSDLPPALVLPPPTPTFTVGGPPVLIYPGALVSDSDSADFANGSLDIFEEGFVNPTDQLLIRSDGSGPGQIGLVDVTSHDGLTRGTVTFGGVPIGLFFGVLPGFSISPSVLVFFNSSAATPAAAQALIRNLAFSNTSNPRSDIQREISLTVDDGDGGRAGPLVTKVNVVDPCRPRPPVRVSVGPSSPSGRPVTVTSGLGNLTSVHFHDSPNSHVASPNVLIDIGDLHALVGDITVALPAGTTSQQFTFRPANPSRPTMLPFDVVDGCGTWTTFVGGGTGTISQGPALTPGRLF